MCIRLDSFIIALLTPFETEHNFLVVVKGNTFISTSVHSQHGHVHIAPYYCKLLNCSQIRVYYDTVSLIRSLHVATSPNHLRQTKEKVMIIDDCRMKRKSDHNMKPCLAKRKWEQHSLRRPPVPEAGCWER